MSASNVRGSRPAQALFLNRALIGRMARKISESTTAKAVGYAALIRRFEIEVIDNWHLSSVSTTGIHSVDASKGPVLEIYPSRYWPGDSLGCQLEFALKYDGTNLSILATLFSKFRAAELRDFTAYIQAKPHGKYARRLWFLYEYLTQLRLSLDDLASGNYVDLLEPAEYYTVLPATRIRRQRVNDNLLGKRGFCPTVRRSTTLDLFENKDLPSRCRDLVAAYPSELMHRALRYLYSKETKSSFAIEHIKSSSSRTERFIALLRLAETEDFCTKERLIEVNNRIVDPRFQASDYRTLQNYVGPSISWERERVRFVSPKPEDLEDLMAGLLESHQCMSAAAISAVVHAATIAYGFVFMHPFEDGNGRIHRFLIHNILARCAFIPDRIMFPVSAAMLNNLKAYDASLEAFSLPLLPLVNYSMDAEGSMSVANETGTWYRYPDLTTQCEALFAFIEQTINSELANELSFLANYDATKSAIQGIVDMPDRKIDLFIRCCLQGEFRLAARKRDSHFDFLSPEEIGRMEHAVEASWG